MLLTVYITVREMKGNFLANFNDWFPISDNIQWNLDAPHLSRQFATDFVPIFHVSSLIAFKFSYPARSEYWYLINLIQQQYRYINIWFLENLVKGALMLYWCFDPDLLREFHIGLGKLRFFFCGEILRKLLFYLWTLF